MSVLTLHTASGSSQQLHCQELLNHRCPAALYNPPRSFMRRTPPLVVSGIVACLTATAPPTQRMDAFVESRDHPAIAYTTAAVSDPVADLGRQLQQGSVHLTFDGASGYLRSVLDALKIPIEESQLFRR